MGGENAKGFTYRYEVMGLHVCSGPRAGERFEDISVWL
jgi:hypothetical protein